jgi:hypothetical protein
VRRLTEEYILAIAGSDLEKMRSFWNPESRDLALRLRFYKELFLEARLEFVRANVASLEITGDNARSLTITDERQLDKKTGAGLLTYDPVQGCSRRFEWVRTGAGWKLENESVVQEALAARLEAASSDRERDEILEKEQTFVTVALIRAFSSRGMRHHQRGDSTAAMRSFRLQEVVSERLGNRVGIAGAWMNYGLVKTSDDD